MSGADTWFHGCRSDFVEPTLRSAIEALVIEHEWLIDHGQAQRLPELYTQDGRLLGVAGDLVGQAALANWSARRAAMTERTVRHVCSNIHLKMQSPDRVLGTVLIMVFRRDGSVDSPAIPALVGDYEDTYQLCPDGRWRFAERRFVRVFGA